MKKEDLTSIEGLTEAQITAIISASTEELKGFIPKSRFDEVNTEKKNLEASKTTLEGQLETLKKSTGDTDALKAQIDQLQKDNKAKDEVHAAELKEIKIDTAIKDKLTDTKYPDLLATKFDKSKLVVGTDGAVSGIDEQLTGIKETYKDLFTPVVKGNDPYNKEKNPNGTKNPWSKEHFNLTEQGKLIKENPALAAQFKASV